MQERIKEHDRDIQLARTQTSAVSGHQLWNEVKFIDRDSHWYTRRVKEAIHQRLLPDNINRDNGIEIPEAWIPAIKKHNGRPVHQRTADSLGHIHFWTYIFLQCDCTRPNQNKTSLAERNWDQP